MTDRILEAMANVLRSQAQLDCVCDYTPANWDRSTMVSIKALGYGPGRPKNLVSYDSTRGEVFVCVPRRASSNSFADEYGLRVLRFEDDAAANTIGKPVHWVIMTAEVFKPLVARGPDAPISSFLVNAVRSALRLRGLSSAGLAKLDSTEKAFVSGCGWDNEDDYDNTPDTAEEGRRLTRAHVAIERDAKLIMLKKRATKSSTGRLGCEVCDTDFSEYYGDIGTGFCEVHHRRPLGESAGNVTTSLAELAVLCSNCHRIVHRSRLSVESLRERLFPPKQQ